MRWTILRKGLFLVSLPLLFQFLFLVLLARVQAKEDDVQKGAAHTRKVIAHCQEVLVGMVDAETGIRGYVLTSNPVFKEPYSAALKTIPGLLRGLQELTESNADQSAAAADVADRTRKALDWLMATEALADRKQ